MYTPMKYRTMDDLLGVIETEKAFLANSGGGFLCVDKLFRPAPQMGVVVVKTPSLQKADIDFLIAQYAAKDPAVALHVVPVFCWADRWVKQSDYADVETYAQALVDTGAAIIG